MGQLDLAKIQRRYNVARSAQMEMIEEASSDMAWLGWKPHVPWWRLDIRLRAWLTPREPEVK